jgi:sulfopropanediol 3-dehydrogenase
VNPEFAEKQREAIVDLEVENLPGIHLGQKVIPIEASGSYIPGGRYPMPAHGISCKVRVDKYA